MGGGTSRTLSWNFGEKSIQISGWGLVTHGAMALQPNGFRFRFIPLALSLASAAISPVESLVTLLLVFLPAFLYLCVCFFLLFLG